MLTQTATSPSQASTTELQNAIRQQLLTDPRTARLNPNQLNSLVQTLSNQASKQGITPAQITWTPGVVRSRLIATPQTPTTTCSGNDPFCNMSLQNGIPEIWILLGVFLVVLIGAGIVGWIMRMVRKTSTH